MLFSSLAVSTVLFRTDGVLMCAVISISLVEDYHR
jgi:hypothetical protein